MQYYVRKTVLFLFLSLIICEEQFAQLKADRIFPVRGFAIGAPSPRVVDSFIQFIDMELAPKKVNTLILRVVYNYQFKSHPELIDGAALSETAVKKIVAVCRKNNIRIIPQINLLGINRGRVALVNYSLYILSSMKRHM